MSPASQVITRKCSNFWKHFIHADSFKEEVLPTQYAKLHQDAVGQLSEEEKFQGMLCYFQRKILIRENFFFSATKQLELNDRDHNAEQAE